MFYIYLDDLAILYCFICFCRFILSNIMFASSICINFYLNNLTTAICISYNSTHSICHNTHYSGQCGI